MAGRVYSRVQQLAGAALARLKGADAAASELSTDKRTVRRWLAKAPEGWELTRDLAHARLQEQLASGKLNAVTLATVAGIGDRNLRYGELIRRREARRAEEQPEPEQPNPVREALAALDNDHRRLVVMWMDTIEIEEELALQRGEEPRRPPDDSEDSEAQMLAWVAGIAALTVEEVAARDAELNARQREIRDLIDAELQARNAPPDPPPPEPPQDGCGLTPSHRSRRLLSRLRASQRRPGPTALRVVSDQERSDPFSDYNPPSWRRDR